MTTIIKGWFLHAVLVGLLALMAVGFFAWGALSVIHAFETRMEQRVEQIDEPNNEPSGWRISL